MSSINLRLKNCEIRKWQEKDINSLAENADDKEIWSNLRDFFPHPYTLKDAQEWIVIANESQPPSNFAIVVDGYGVGGISLTLHTDIERKSAEIGYWLGSKHRNKGIMSEAVEAVTDHGFDVFDLCRVFAVPFDGNVGSIKVLEKAGYEFEGRMKKSAIKEGRIIDQLLYAKVR
jgi:[ribosomal protein S5]-alanine N-acetyltransferase